MSVTTQFDKSTYSSSNKPSTSTLKSDISNLGTDHNTLETAFEVEHNSSGTHKSDVGITGEVKLYTATTAPDGWLLCRGQAISRATYSGLFAVISTTYGVGDGSSTFNLPNMQGKMVMGVSESDGDFDLSDTGGAKTHTITTAEMPTHTHTGPSHTHTGPSHTHTGSTGTVSVDHTHSSTVQFWQNASGGDATHELGSSNTNAKVATVVTGGFSANHTHGFTTAAGGTGNTGASGTGATGSAGSGTAHSIMNPFIALNYIIKT